MDELPALSVDLVKLLRQHNPPLQSGDLMGLSDEQRGIVLGAHKLIESLEQRIKQEQDDVFG